MHDSSSNDRLNIVVYTSEPVPNGMAATNRLFSYCKGLCLLGNTVTVCSSKPSFNGIHKYDYIDGSSISGKYDSVDYVILHSNNNWNLNLFYKIKFYLLSLFRFHLYLNKIRKYHPKTVVILVTNKLFSILFIRISTFILDIKLIQEKSEYPFLFLSSNWVKRIILSTVYSRIVYFLMDGIIVMTSNLSVFFKKYIRKSAGIFKLPLTVDTSFFIHAFPSDKYDYRYIGYAGYMSGNKDGIIDLLKSFVIIHERDKDIRLVLAGYANSSDLEVYNKFIRSNGISNFVIFAGVLTREEIPGFYKAAEVLVLTRPNTLQASGGFPSKVGEYLSTGVPVVVTKVGEVPYFLKDGDNALLCSPGDIEEIAKKILLVLSNTDFYKGLGLNGQKCAIENFDYINTSRDLERFIYSIVDGK